MKNRYMLTKEVTKYWKKAIQTDAVMVTRRDDKIYILNGYNAFIIPALPVVWDEIVRPALAMEMPENNAAFQFVKGEKQAAVQADIINIIEKCTQDKTPAMRTPFTYDAANGSLRLYKNANDALTAVSTKYDAMIDYALADNIYCGGRCSPVVFETICFTALLMPVRINDSFTPDVKMTFKKVFQS